MPLTSPTSTHSPQREYQLIQQVYVLMDDHDRQILSEYGLNTSQYRLLSMLNGSGQRLTLLSDRLLLSKSTITRAVDQLEKQGWVKRVPDPDDRRAQQIVFTNHGELQYHGVVSAHRAALQKSFEQLSVDEREQLGALLGKLRDGLVTVLSGNKVVR